MSKLPFGILPGHWGLKGKTREIAKAEYELEGYELEKKLLSLKEDELESKDYNKRMIDLEFKHGRITKQEQLRYLCNLIEDEKQRTLALLELDFKEGALTITEYQKQTATLNGEPWVIVLNLGIGGKTALEGSFELDWNEFFIEDLRTKGYVGPSEDHIVNQWFMEVCRTIALEEFDGTGDFTADSAANMEAMKRWNSTESYANGRKGYQ
jgi:hypothetical protein